jgi:hypothetical protein
MEMGYGLNGRGSGFDSRQGQDIFLFSTSSRQALVFTQSPIRWVPGSLSPEVKLPGRETDHCPVSDAEVESQWNYTITSPHIFMTYCLIVYVRDNFTFSVKLAMLLITQVV